MLPLYGQIISSILILRKAATCEKHEIFQCNNAKCIWKYRILDSRDDCGDNSDALRTNGAFCGM